MGIGLILAFAVALLGFVLLLRPEPLWRCLRKNKDDAISSAMAALLRLCGIGCLALSVALAQWVQ